MFLILDAKLSDGGVERNRKQAEIVTFKSMNREIYVNRYSPYYNVSSFHQFLHLMRPGHVNYDGGRILMPLTKGSIPCWLIASYMLVNISEWVTTESLLTKDKRHVLPPTDLLDSRSGYHPTTSDKHFDLPPP